MGFDENGIDYRATYLQDYVYGLMEEIVDGELDIKAELHQKMVEYRDKVQELQKRLHVVIEEPKQPFRNPLKEHDHYKQLYSKLQDIKEENRKLLLKLKKEEGKLCKDLNENEIDVPSDREYKDLATGSWTCSGSVLTSISPANASFKLLTKSGGTDDKPLVIIVNLLIPNISLIPLYKSLIA